MMYTRPHPRTNTYTAGGHGQHIEYVLYIHGTLYMCKGILAICTCRIL